jgi:DNA repair exonuclease SbcCD ATPase subunit
LFFIILINFKENNKIVGYFKMNTLRIPTNYINLENRDQQLLQIENLIDAKRKMLIGKQKKFKNLTKQNEFLNEVKQDYNKYYGYIVKQKEDQMSALTLLNGYIKDLTISGTLSKNNIQDAKNEQNKILTEINSIKKGIDDIIKETGNINSAVKHKEV